MRRQLISFFWAGMLSLLSCSPPAIRLSADFDRGSIGQMTEVEPGYFKGNTRHWLKRDSIGDQYYWFYFQADNVKGKNTTFEISDLEGIYRGETHIVYTDYTQPVYSYDKENWERISQVSYDSASYTFRFSQSFVKEPVWIAYAHPYPTSRMNQVRHQADTSRYAEVTEIAKTDEGRGIFLFRITDPLVPDVAKKNILILAMQHAGEDAGGFMAEGMIKFLLSGEEQAEFARQHFNYLIIPMMNPDGLYHGISRYNVQMEDLNNIWMDDDKAQPEVAGVKAWAESWFAEGNSLDLFLDIHNHTQFHQYNVFIFQDHGLDDLVPIMDELWPVRIWHSEFKGSSCSYFFRKGIPSGTIELSQSHLADGVYLDIKNYQAFGKGAVIALNRFYSK